MVYTITKKDRKIQGLVKLTASKSISNRVLIIRALCAEHFEIKNLAEAQDTDTMLALLTSKARTKDAGPAGTTFRFLTAFLCLQEGDFLLTGSERMKKRPIGPLVDALRSIGADIQYEEVEGFPPLRIKNSAKMGLKSVLEIPANISSQFISALLLIAPALPNGLVINLVGKIVSRPYILMTLNLMKYFGAEYEWEGNCIKVAPKKYQAKKIRIEGDWSAASYYYALAAFSEETDLYLDGLHRNSTQGDAVIAKLMESFGVKTRFDEYGIHLTKEEHLAQKFDYDFLECPDIAQSLMTVCAGLEVPAHLKGLETLKIKETDRIAAMANELAKLGAQLENQGSEAMLTGNSINRKAKPRFSTYEDHRMAMALFPLSMLLDQIQIEEPDVVGKSYPAFWKDMNSLGFEID